MNMKPHLLVVATKPTVRTMFSRFLRKRGFAVTTASDSLEARQLAERLPVDVLIVDIDLRGEDSTKLLRFFRDHLPGIPVLMTAGITQKGEFETTKLTGVNCFLRKDWSLEVAFLEVLRQMRAASAGTAEQDNYSN
jgi:CheY-like chemotaxis protein